MKALTRFVSAAAAALAVSAFAASAASAGQGSFLYVRTGAAGLVDEFAVGAGGGLTPLGSVAVPGGAGGEGIAAA